AVRRLLLGGSAAQPGDPRPSARRGLSAHLGERRRGPGDGWPVVVGQDPCRGRDDPARPDAAGVHRAHRGGQDRQERRRDTPARLPARPRPGRSQPMTSPAAALRPRPGVPWARPSEQSGRWLRRRVGIAWALLLLNVLTFYPQTWSGQPLVVPIPAALGKLVTQGALPAALLAALSTNRRLRI